MRFNLPESPFIRIVIPLTTGVILYNECKLSTILPAIILAASTISVYLISNKINNPAIKYKINPYYPYLFFGLYIAAGWICAYINRPATINDKLIGKELFFTADAESILHKNVTTEIISTCNVGNTKIPLILTLQGNDYSVEAGDKIRCYSKIEEFKSSNTPDAFDYKKYMEHKGFKYRSFVPETRYKIIGHHNSLKTKAVKIKESVIDKIRNTELEHDTKNFIIAILTGNDEFISEETRDSFSNAGIAHILAVSGLHIGILGLIAAFLLKPLDYAGLRKLRFIITLTVIWVLTYIIGMPASACRAAIMTTFLFAAILFYKKHNILNALSASAVLIIIFSPSSIYDIGFQLSYLSVLGIILFADKLTCSGKNKAIRKISSVIAVSIAAQLGTAVVVAYYFNMLPINFLIGNIVVVPILPIFMFLSITLIILSSIGFGFSAINHAADFIYQIIINVTDFSNSIPFSTIENIPIDAFTTLCLATAIFSTGVWLNIKRSRTRTSILYFAMSVTLTGCGNQIIHETKISKEGIFLSDGYSSTNIIYYSRNKAIIINSRNDTAEISKFSEQNKRFFAKHNIDSIISINTAYYNGNIYFDYPYVCIRGKRFAFATGNIKKRQKRTVKTDVDYLIITNNFYNDVSILPDYYNFSQIVVTNELYDKAPVLNRLQNIGFKYSDLEEAGLHIKL